MSWKDLKIGKKLYIGFGVVLALLVIASIFNYNSFTQISKFTKQAEDANGNQLFFTEKEVDHLEWLNNLKMTFLDEEVTTVTVETDPHKCGLGKWLYGDEAKRLRAEDPEIARLLDEIEEPHRHLHESASEIKAHYRHFDTKLADILADKWVLHLKWAQDLSNSLLFKDVFSGGLDPHKCPFGSWYYSYETDDKDAAEMLLKFEEPHRRLHEVAARIVRLQKNGDYTTASNLYSREFLPALNEFSDSYDQIHVWIADLVKKQEKANQIYEQKTEPSVGQTQAIMADVKDHFSNQSQESAQSLHAAISKTVTMMIVISLVAIVIGIGAAYFITRGISKPVSEISQIADDIAVGNVDHTIELNSKDEIGLLAQSFRKLIDYMKELSAAAQSIAENDLTVSVTPKSENDVLGNSFATMINNLTEMVTVLNDNASQLVSAASEVASSSEQMSRGAQDQTSQVSQISTAIEEMSATIVESSKNAGEASDASRTAADTATSGGRLVSDTIEGMQRIDQVVRESSGSIGQLAKSADQIGEIIGVIDDIADQTNLLALNAAIEAARAGEQGRGFAVVADEVRKLAERTGKATGEITEMIKGIQEETSGAVNAMESGMNEVGQGRDLADKAGNSLTEIVNMSQQVMDMIQQIATASEEQSAAAEQISKNIEAVSAITRETASGAEQSASAAEQLNRQAEDLKSMVAKFKVTQNA
ncbi:MAG: HAMP domain-containing protein [candidate division Zixibacteria bacterium]|nr:HAMP domain-containing protein [candidate division Zixibacteria bacterium]